MVNAEDSKLEEMLAMTYLQTKKIHTEKEIQSKSVSTI